MVILMVTVNLLLVLKYKTLVKLILATIISCYTYTVYTCITILYNTARYVEVTVIQGISGYSTLTFFHSFQVCAFLAHPR